MTCQEHTVISPTERSQDFYCLKLRHYSHLVNSTEELSLRKSTISHRSHYLGKWQQWVMFDYEVGVLVAVRMFSCAASFNTKFVVVPELDKMI